MADANDQRSKKAAAAAYDYDSDPRWAEYWSNVLIPPTMASRSDVVDHYKRKFYQRHIDPELIVEAMSSTSSSQSSGTPGESRTSTAPQQPASRNSGAGAGTGSRSAPSGTNTNRVQLNSQTIQFSVNAWILVVALVGIFPLVPRSLSYKAYRLSLLGTACSSLYSVYMLYGKPRSWNLPGVQGWLQTVIGTKDFMCFFYCIVFVSFQAHFKSYYLNPKYHYKHNLGTRPELLSALQVVVEKLVKSRDVQTHCMNEIKYFRESLGSFGRMVAVNGRNNTLPVAELPLICRAVEQNAKFLRRHFSRSSLYRRFFEKPCAWVDANTTTLAILTSNAEVALGFLLVLSLVSWQRSIVQTFVYWNLLKLLYHAPATAGHHKAIWAKIGRISQPYIVRYVPFLKTPLSAIQRWWFN